ncbi:hypothetical protein AA0473_1739 [Acetobacter orleanensis NRIC 0473]|nr:hypothetical protein AA0473_1739 [Acetobacter orleanensis NRIC 0473]
MSVISQMVTGFRQGQVIFPGNQRMDTPRLRLDPVRQTIPATRSGGSAAGRDSKSAPANRTRRTDAKPFSRLTTRQTIQYSSDNTFEKIQRQCA